MKLPNINILDEKNSILHKKSLEVTFPLSKEDLQTIEDIKLYLKMSQIDDEREKYDLRAGMGLAFVQLGILKRIFVIVHEYEEGKFNNYVVINPKIISFSEEMICVEEGEGCLSVNRDVEGIIGRYARMKVEAYDEQGKLYEIRVREELSVAFQHEIDHLNGIIFPDLIDPKDPYKNIEKMRTI